MALVMNVRGVSVLLLLALVAQSTMAAFSAKQFFEGEWALDRTSFLLDSKQKTMGEAELIQTKLHLSGNETLSGVYEYSEINIEISFESDTQATFKFFDEEGSELEVVQIELNSVERLPFEARGPFKHGAYHLIITSPLTLIVQMHTFTDNEGLQQFTTYVGTKTPPPQQQSFFGKYGTWIMLAVFLGMQLLRARSAMGQGRAQVGEGEPAAAAAADKKNTMRQLEVWSSISGTPSELAFQRNQLRFGLCCLCDGASHTDDVRIAIQQGLSVSASCLHG